MRQYFATPVSDHLSRTQQGYLICHDVPIGRTGWYKYHRDDLLLEDEASDAMDADVVAQLKAMDGNIIVSVFRSPSEVFHPDALSSFEGVSVTELHPPEFLNAANDSAYSRGHAQNVRKGGKLESGDQAPLADMHVKDEALAGKIERKEIREVSCGYTYRLRRMADGQFEQYEIRGNHIAFVPKGRAGSECAAMDNAPPETKENPYMAKTKQSWWKAVGLRSLAKDEKVTDEQFHERLASLDEDDDEDEKKKKEKEKEGEDKAITKEAIDAMIKAAVDAALAKKGKDEEDDDEEKKKKEKEKEAEDALAADLVAASDEEEDDEEDDEKRKGKEKPAEDAAGQLAQLRALKPAIAQSGNKKAIDSYNSVMRALHSGKVQQPGKIADLLSLKAPEGVQSAIDASTAASAKSLTDNWAAAAEAIRLAGKK